MSNQLSYIDIFAGCGGLSVGLYNAGWKGLFAIEKNSDAFETLKHNLIDNKKHFSWCNWLSIESHDINQILQINKQDLEKLRGKVDLVAGGPPCQGFSTAGKRDANDIRNKLVDSYISFIKLIMPKALLFENVRGFTVHFKNDEMKKQYSSYVETELRKLGYDVAHQIIDMSEYGIPQKRRRFILVALLNDVNNNSNKLSASKVFDLLVANKDKFCKSHGISAKTSVYDAISDLEMENGVVPSPDSRNFMAGKYGKSQSAYQKLLRKGVLKSTNAVDSHRFVNHSNKTIDLHKKLLKIAPKGKHITPQSSIVPELNRRGVTVLDKDRPSPTITSIPDELIHYSEPRIVTVRESARLQSFPDWFEFKGKYTSGGELRKKEVPRYTQVGNAVPPLFAEQIGLAIKKVLENE